MSQATDRLPLEAAQTAAGTLMQLWGMQEPDCMVVGSVRRRRPDIGDIEIIAPMPDSKNADELYAAIAPTVGTGGLFGAGSVPVGRVVQGLKAGFRSCSLVVDMTHSTGAAVSVAVQIFRYIPLINCGWITVMRTGPSEFGQAFLSQWKHHWQIPPHQQASVEGNLVNAGGRVVPTATEADAFRLCGLPYIEPWERTDGAVARAVTDARRRQREALR